jgi:ribosomal protein S18 acetylase RimI-like enzyme
MKEREIEILIENNLHDLYRFVAERCNLPHVKTDFCEWVHASPSPWPDYIFGADFSKMNMTVAVNDIDNNIQLNKAPSFWIDKHSSHSVPLLESVSKNNFRLIMQWPGMALSLADIVVPPNPDKDLKIQVVSETDSLFEWTKIVNIELFPNNTINLAFFEKLLNSDEVIFLLGKINNVPVSTSMLFLRNNVAGIYMVSTSHDYRKKGIAQTMTKEAIKLSQSHKIDYMVLEANKESHGLYHKSGFKTFCTFDIYWKLPVI